MTPSCYLYVPGNRPDRFAGALSSGAGAVVFDLEDAVPAAAKSSARDAIATHLRQEATDDVQQWVRINAGDAAADDIAAVQALPGLTGIVLPKASAATAALSGTRIIALIETAGSFLELADIARRPGVERLAMGEVDLAGELGITPSDDEHEMWPMRMQVVVVSAATGAEPPIGPVFTAIPDEEGLRSTSAALWRAGFEARQAIHPRQVAIINAVMTPSSADIERGHVLLELSARGGAVCVDETGRMIDEASLRWARRTEARAASRPLQA